MIVMKTLKRVLALTLAAGLLAGLAGCQSDTKNATTFIQGELDCYYKGQFNKEYVDVVADMTEETARQNYEEWTEAEAEILVSFLGMDSEVPTDETLERAQDVVKEIYAKCKYTVAEAEKLSTGDIAVEVTVSPVEIFHLLDDGVYADTWSDVLAEAGVTSQEELDAVNDEDYQALDMEYVMRLLDEVEKVIPQLTYGTDQTILLQLKKDSDGRYALVDNGWDKLDEVIVDYNGYYMQ